MAHSKRPKSSGNGAKKQVAAKQAVKRKQKTITKYKIAEMRDALDSQTQVLYAVSSSEYSAHRVMFIDDIQTQLKSGAEVQETSTYTPELRPESVQDITVAMARGTL